ncbi:hypothetical protein [Peredibacter starrii]|uniref:Uncharacterized protein n=1 Tax=Peredibacter starrii TaxID=28202 RepID=A0AAX4HS00_9BACT|nr:hypothetical protein [Peredibacter starrii]WPU66141.1 hypothetical protein SOO65_05220 [Peredibacter starrii]
MRWLIILLMLAGCSGYRFSQQENPLSQYGIQSLSVPMFYNYSNISEASGEFTRETYRLLTGFSGLKLYNGYKSSSDAILIGIIKSPEKMYDSLRPNNLRVAQDKAPNSIGTTRENFYIPGTTDVQLYLQVIVIKKPSEEELSLLKSGIGDQVRTNSKIIFNEVIPLKMQYTREILDNQGTQVNATQNFGAQRKTIRTMAEQAAVTVRDMIFYAF